MRLPPPPPSGNPPAAGCDDLPTIFSVLRKLGLELKQQEATVPVYTVAHVERPAGDGGRHTIERVKTVADAKSIEEPSDRKNDVTEPPPNFNSRRPAARQDEGTQGTRRQGRSLD